MIQESFNGMLTLLLAKFVLNDVPHAAGMYPRTKFQKQYARRVEYKGRSVWQFPGRTHTFIPKDILITSGIKPSEDEYNTYYEIWMIAKSEVVGYVPIDDIVSLGGFDASTVYNHLTWLTKNQKGHLNIDRMGKAVYFKFEKRSAPNPGADQYTYHLGTLPKDVEADIARMTFTTKAETARHYQFHIYVPEQPVWLAPRNVADPNWGAILPRLEHGNPMAVPTGTCYPDAWRYVIQHPEGLLAHGTALSAVTGKRVGHAWVELPDGTVWEPYSQAVLPIEEFYRLVEPVVEDRYTAEEAAIMLARAGKHGPWSAEERREYIGR